MDRVFIRYVLVCAEDEWDCEDATCISIRLRCNGNVNCRFRWDEDDCVVEYF